METRKAYQDTHVTIDLDDAIFKDFLDSQKPRTRKSYECFVRKLVEYAHLSGQQLLDQQEQWNRKILIFSNTSKAKATQTAMRLRAVQWLGHSLTSMTNR